MTKKVLQVVSVEALHEAVASARRLRSEQPKRAIDIELQAGIYQLEHSLDLGPEDSGTTEGPLRILAAAGAEVIFTGSRRLGDDTRASLFGEITSPDVVNRLTAAQRQHLVEISMAAAGIPPVEEIEQRGPPPIELFCEGQRLPLSRFPKQDWLQIEDVPFRGQGIGISMSFILY